VLQMLVSRVAALTNREYAFVHFDTSDQRGIDIAFIFRPQLFSAPADQRFQHVVMRRTATREILQVNFQTNKNRTWAVFGNHWPSRSGGQFESEGYREIAGETLGYFHQRVLEVHGEDTPVLAMGDFNDEPFNRSLSDHALSVEQKAKVLNATSRPLLLNMMWEAAGRREGSLYFDNTPNLLDQFLVNRNMLRPNSTILRRANGTSANSGDVWTRAAIGVRNQAQRPCSGDDHHSAGRVGSLRALTRAVSWAGPRVTPSNRLSASSGRSSFAVSRFSRRCANDDVPGIRRTFGARRSSHASATCIGVAPRPCATLDNVDD
jgi:hypothetical protein